MPRMNRGDLTTNLELRWETIPWSEFEVAFVTEMYERAARPGGVLNLKWIASRIDRSRANICRKARDLGLTNQRRIKGTKGGRKPRVEPPPKYATKAERSAAQSARMKVQWIDRPHPRGMLGKRHTPEALAAMAVNSAARWAAMTEEQIAERAMKIAKTRAESIVAGRLINERKGVTWKGGWRQVGDQRKYFRSRWEANYAYYLEWLRTIGQIASWQHEAKTFWFEGIKRGCVSYLPDFKVTNLNGSIEWHEVKGWMDARSATVLKRMAKYHPNEKLIVIAEKQYKEILRKVSTLVPGWES